MPSEPLIRPYSEEPETLYRTLREREERVRSLEGTARLRIRTGEKTARLEATLVCERPESLRCEVTDFLDHLIFLIVFRDGILSTFSVPENRFSRGQALPGRVQEFLGVPLTAEELISLTLGFPFFVPVQDPLCSVSSGGKGEVLLHVTDPVRGLSYTVRLDREGRPEEVLLVRNTPGSGTQHRLRASFLKYRQRGEVAFPFRIRVREEGTGRRFQVDYHEVELNRELREDLFDFTPPEDAERAAW